MFVSVRYRSVKELGWATETRRLLLVLTHVARSKSGFSIVS